MFTLKISAAWKALMLQAYHQHTSHPLCRRCCCHYYYCSFRQNLQTVDPTDGITILRDVASGLVYLHEEDLPKSCSSPQPSSFKPCMAHCQVEPCNIFIRYDGSACIGNFSSCVSQIASSVVSPEIISVGALDVYIMSQLMLAMSF